MEIILEHVSSCSLSVCFPTSLIKKCEAYNKHSGSPKSLGTRTLGTKITREA